MTYKCARLSHLNPSIDEKDIAITFLYFRKCDNNALKERYMYMQREVGTCLLLKAKFVRYNTPLIHHTEELKHSTIYCLTFSGLKFLFLRKTFFKTEKLRSTATFVAWAFCSRAYWAGEISPRLMLRMFSKSELFKRLTINVLLYAACMDHSQIADFGLG